MLLDTKIVAWYTVNWRAGMWCLFTARKAGAIPLMFEVIGARFNRKVTSFTVFFGYKILYLQ